MNSRYANSPLPKEDLEELKSGFVGFDQLYSMTINLIKNDFVRSGLKPFLWKLLVLFVPYFAFVIGTIATLVAAGFFVSGSDSSVTSITTYAAAFIIIVVLFIALIVYLVFASLNLEVRQIMLLNDTTHKSIWSPNDKKAIRSGMYSVILISILIFLISLVAQIIVSPIGLITSLFLPFVNNVGVYVTSSIISDWVSAAPAYIVVSFFGYSVIYGVLENQGPINSLKSSLRLVRPYYFKNIQRWLPIVIPGFVLLTIEYVVIHTIAFFSNTTNQVANKPLDFSVFLNQYSHVNIPVITSTVLTLVSIAAIILYVFYAIFVYYYSYLTYVNLQLLDEKASSKK